MLGNFKIRPLCPKSRTFFEDGYRLGRRSDERFSGFAPESGSPESCGIYEEKINLTIVF